MSTVPYSFKSTIWDYLYACVYASVCTCVCVCVPMHMFGKGHFQALQREAGICDQAVSTFPIWLGSCFSWPHRACFTPSLCVHLPPSLPPTPCWCSNLLYFLPLQAHSLEYTFLLHGMCLSEPWAWFTHLLIQVLAKLTVSREAGLAQQVKQLSCHLTLSPYLLHSSLHHLLPSKTDPRICLLTVYLPH